MIRKADIYDIERINNLGLLINKKFTKLFNIRDILNEKYSKIFVFFEKDLLVGFLHITELYETVDIINIAVDPKYRNKRIASNLLDYMLSDISREVKLITLEVSTKNKEALALYKKFGFEVINERKGYYDDANAYLMGKGVSYER